MMYSIETVKKLLSVSKYTKEDLQNLAFVSGYFKVKFDKIECLGINDDMRVVFAVTTYYTPGFADSDYDYVDNVFVRIYNSGELEFEY